MCSVCFLQKETKKSPKTQKSRFLCPKRFLAFSVQCLFCKIKKLKNADYGQQRAQKSEKSRIFMSEQAIVIRKYNFVKKVENHFVMQYCFDCFSENQLFLLDRSEIDAK